jgi:hypothetical protein
MAKARGYLVIADDLITGSIAASLALPRLVVAFSIRFIRVQRGEYYLNLCVTSVPIRDSRVVARSVEIQAGPDSSN